MQNFTFNCKGKLLVFNKPVVMGILNVTPDSFYDGGKYTNEESVLRKAEQMLLEGAAILDIGGMSTRPGAAIISEAEELERISSNVMLLAKTFPEALLSIDTFRSKVAEAAIQSGASIINDISGGMHDSQMFRVAATYRVPLILMHMQGRIDQMHATAHYKHLLSDMLDYFTKQILLAETSGIKDVVIDVGFGFSKTIEQNFHLLKHLHVFRILNKPLLAGLSRKSMLYKTLGTTPQNALNATAFAHAIALQQGASVLRAHDVKEAVECITLFEQLQKA
jgi:dihydropteroate synthase